MFNIKKGQKFIDNENNNYYFLGYINNNTFAYTTKALISNNQYLESDNSLIKEITNEYDEDIKNYAWYYQEKQELENSTLEEKLDRVLSIFKSNEDDWNNKEYDMKPIKIGPLVRGKAYYHEVDQYYEVIGFLVDMATYKNSELESTEIGFHSIYHSTCHNYAPLLFLENEDISNFETKKLSNGCGDYFEVVEIMLDEETVNNYIVNNDYDILKYENNKVKEVSDDFGK